MGRRFFASPQLARTWVLLPRAWAGALFWTCVRSLSARSGWTVAPPLVASLCTVCHLILTSSGVSVSHLALVALLVVHLVVVVVVAAKDVVVIAEDVVEKVLPALHAIAKRAASDFAVNCRTSTPRHKKIFDEMTFWGRLGCPALIRVAPN